MDSKRRSGVRGRESSDESDSSRKTQKRDSLHDLSSLPRHERQQLYADILREKMTVMTPGLVKDELEKKGMTFQFVGQDMAAMRLMPFVEIQARGQYRWKSSYTGDGLVVAGKQSKRRRSFSSMELSDEDVPYMPPTSRRSLTESNSESESSVAQALFSHVQVSDEASAQEKERAIRNLDALLAIADGHDTVPRMRELDLKGTTTHGVDEVCGYRVK